MPLSDALLPEFDHEMASVRKHLERVPDDKLAWKPHEKSMPLGRLAMHLAEIPGWVVPTIQQDSLDLAPPGGPEFKPRPAGSRQEALEAFDKNVKQARAVIESASDAHLMKPWSLLAGGKTIFTLPRIATLRSFVFSHAIHHRAQLGVYLRLNDVPVPSSYGPTADEGQM
jgi:uncharacterized damage-inducible protein DinB